MTSVVYSQVGACSLVDRGLGAYYAGPVRWEALFEDLESQLAGSARAASDSEIAERARIDFSAGMLEDRLYGQIGQTVSARAGGELVLSGRIDRVGAGWFILDGGVRSVLVPLTAVDYVDGLARAAVPPVISPRRRPSLSAALRVLVRDRAEVVVSLAGSSSARQLAGTLDRVGRDYCELAVTRAGEQRRHRNVSAVLAVPFRAMLAVSWLNGPSAG